MPNLLRKRQIIHSRLAGIQFPRVQVEHRRSPAIVDFPEAVLCVGIGEQAKVTSPSEWKSSPEHFQTTHRKLVQPFGNLVRNQRRIRNAIIRMKADRKY